MSGMVFGRKKGEMRLWKALLRSTDAELMAAYAAGDRSAVRRLEYEARTIRSQIVSLNGELRAIPVAG